MKGCRKAPRPILMYFFFVVVFGWFPPGFRWSDGAGFVYSSKTESLLLQFLFCLVNMKVKIRPLRGLIRPIRAL